ncbi:Flavin-dependent oxidoreductase FOX4 [Colletotrichum chlorophyti]|uniref:Flavin-dependent oxidoreductase FOX4 n=1 Tax=Colletotrichum chlorophyti TaxID=708187 RepID=A0A1Q8RM44_9PEZI|nr:Flavin-dependent oxidoreductase FOX4 [Colletotrichum chlorophyti]
MRSSFILSLVATALPLTAANPLPQQSTSKPKDIQSCLNAAKVPITVQSSADWSADIRPYNTRLAYTPSIVVTATDPKHVQDTVKCGFALGLKVTARGGGHSYSSSGLGGENNHVVIRLDEMFAVKLNSDNTATIQAGARLGHVAIELFNQGGRAISHGSCPGVGTSGHSLHGGFGFSSSTYGLATDWIVEATVVLANGTVAKASQTQNPDLFWALRGAGSSFGIVTEFKFNTFEAPDVVTTFKVPFNLNQSKLADALVALQKYAQNDKPTELNMRAVITPGDTHFDGLYFGSASQARSVLQKFLSANSKLGINLNGATITATDWIGQLEYYAGQELDQTGPQDAAESFYASSLMTTVVPDAGFKNFADFYFNKAKSFQSGWFVLVDVHGGKNSKVSQAVPSSSYAHRDKVLMWQFYNADYSGAATYSRDNIKFMQDWMSRVSSTLVQPWGRYANYPDTELSSVAAQEQYYMGSLARLRTVKKQLDSKNVFAYPQGITLV